MTARAGLDDVVAALAAGDLQQAQSLVADALKAAEATSDLDAVARLRLASLGIARLRGDAAAEGRELRALEAAAAAHPASAVEVACDLARARLLLEQNDPRGAVSMLRRAVFKRACGIGENLSSAVFADLMLEFSKRPIADKGLAADLQSTLLALAPPEQARTASVVLDAYRDADGNSAAKKALKAKRAGRHSDAAWLYLGSTAGSIRQGSVRLAIKRLLDARNEAVLAVDPVAYTVAAVLLFVLYIATGRPVNAVATALRAKASLEDLLGPGAGDDFKSLLEMWRLAVGEDVFKEHLQAFVEARKKGAM